MDTLTEIIRKSRAEAEDALEKYRSMPKGKSDVKAIAGEIKNIANQHVLTFLIAYNMKERGEESILLTRTAQKLMPEHIAAAKFLVKYNLI